MTELKNKITSANILVGDNKYKEALTLYIEALNEAEFNEQKIDVLNAIGRLYLNTGDVTKAIKTFQKSIDKHNELDSEIAKRLIVNKATVLNNLGALTVKDNPKKAMEFHKEALTIFKDIVNVSPEYKQHLANTFYSYADAAYAKGDFYMAKKQYKEAIKQYAELGESEITLPLIANAHYNLGNVYTDENAVYDARNNYLKALKIFRKLSENNPKAYKSLVGATYNNLAVTAKTMYKYADAITYYENALKEYEYLTKENRTTFLPFYAATLNSIGIIYSEQHEVKDDYDSFGLTGFSGFGTLSTDNSIDNKEKKKQLEQYRKEKAKEYYLKAIDIYTELTTQQPELFSHYLATTFHNLGVLYDTMGEFKKAEEFFEKALNIRRHLASQYPKEFNLDVCVTLFNVVTMYQNLLEQTVNMGFKDESLKILNEIETRLELYKDDQRPIVQGMFSDLKYFKDYFSVINNEYLDVFDAIVKENAVIEKINETPEPSKKFQMQKHVINLYYALYEKYPNNPKLKEVLLNAYVKYAWFALRSNEISIAERTIERGYNINKNNLNLKANEALAYLLKNNIEKFKKIYDSIKNKENEDNKSYKKVIEEDLIVLKRDGVLINSNIDELIK